MKTRPWQSLDKHREKEAGVHGALFSWAESGLVTVENVGGLPCAVTVPCAHPVPALCRHRAVCRAASRVLSTTFLWCIVPMN